MPVEHDNAKLNSTGVISTKSGFLTNVITSGSLPTAHSITSGVPFQVTSTRDFHMCVQTSTAGTVAIALSPDGSTYTTIGTKTVGATDVVQVFVPANWHVKLTATSASLGTVTYY